MAFRILPILLLVLTKQIWSLPHETKAEVIPKQLVDRETGHFALDLVKEGPCRYEKADDDTQDVFFHSQVTKPIACGTAASCQATRLEQHTFEYSVEGGGNVPWVSAGFAVTQAWTSGQEYQCGADMGDRVCVWVRVNYLEYHVKPVGGLCNPDVIDRGVVTMRSVKNDQDNYYCVTGSACRTLGEGYWE